MNKTELLNQVAGLPNGPSRAVKLARSPLRGKDVPALLSDDAIASYRKAANQIVKRLKLGCTSVEAIGFVTAFSALSMSLFQSPLWLQHTALSNAFAVVVCAGGGAFVATMALSVLLAYLVNVLGYTSIVELLTPTAGTEYCERGVKALTTGGQLPALWRDAALQERSQLYAFDIEIMEALAQAHTENVAGAKREAQIAQACRVLHGVEAPL